MLLREMRIDARKTRAERHGCAIARKAAAGKILKLKWWKKESKSLNKVCLNGMIFSCARLESCEAARLRGVSRGRLEVALRKDAEFHWGVYYKRVYEQSRRDSSRRLVRKRKEQMTGPTRAALRLTKDAQKQVSAPPKLVGIW
jgi:hypothetical protein